MAKKGCPVNYLALLALGALVLMAIGWFGACAVVEKMNGDRVSPVAAQKAYISSQMRKAGRQCMKWDVVDNVVKCAMVAPARR